jgi:hypothetical protein
MKKKDEPENGVLAFYKEKKKWIPYPAKECPKISQVRMIHEATNWIVKEVMHNDRDEGVKLEFWAYDDSGRKKQSLVFLEGCITKEKEGAWVDVKIRMPWLVI